MRLFSSDPTLPAVISVAQEAVGIIAIGQFATGFIAIGQLARGVFVVGQLAVGVVGIGQAVGCVGYGVGMVGIVGRGWGLVLKLAPKYRRSMGRPEKLPPAMSMRDLENASLGTAATIFGKLRDRVMLDERGAPITGVEPKPVVIQVLQTAPPSCEIALIMQVIEQQADMPPIDHGYRENVIPQKVRAIKVEDAIPWVRWPWPFQSFRADRPAPFWQLAIRAIGLTALLVFWWLIVGQTLGSIALAAFSG